MSSGFNNQPLINGEAYAFAQVAIVIRGQRIYGVTSVDYTQEENKGHNFGPGRYPVSRGYGEIDSNGNMDLDQDAVYIRDAAGTVHLVEQGDNGWK